MSLTRIKIAFDAGVRAIIAANIAEESRAEVAESLWLAFANQLVADAGGESLWIPGTVPDPTAAQRQGELFAKYRASGMTFRQISSATDEPKTTVHRVLSQMDVVLGTAA